MSRLPNSKCSVCEKPIYRRPAEIAKANPFYCSHECKGKSQRKLHKCAVCDNMILSRKHKKTCSRACANKQKIGLKYGKKLGRPVKDKVKDLAALRKRVIQLHGNRCCRCEYSRLPILEMHHIIEKSKNGTDDINNLELICPNCHAEEHYIRRLAGAAELASLERKWPCKGSEGSNPSVSSKSTKDNIMCYLCLQDNPFEIVDPSNRKLADKKERAATVKTLLKEYESSKFLACEDGAKEIEKLKEEQYLLSRDI